MQVVYGFLLTFARANRFDGALSFLDFVDTQFWTVKFLFQNALRRERLVAFWTPTGPADLLPSSANRDGMPVWSFDFFKPEQLSEQHVRVFLFSTAESKPSK